MPFSSLPPTDDVLHLLVLSDLHLSIRPAVTALILDDTDYLRHMHHLVLLGDQTPSWGTDEEYDAVRKFLNDLPLPYTAINGNHEFFFEVVPDPNKPGGKIYNQASPQLKTTRLRKFLDFYNYESLWHAQRTPLGLFIFLALDDITHHRPEAISAAQRQFLTEQLAATEDVPVYVFCHAPLSLGERLDMVYYEPDRTASIELTGQARELCQTRRAPLFWMSGHIHLRPDHYMYPAYQLAPNCWQVHCPDGLGYSRWSREQVKPEMHDGLFSRHLEISRDSLVLGTRDHRAQQEIARQIIAINAEQ